MTVRKNLRRRVDVTRAGKFPLSPARFNLSARAGIEKQSYLKKGIDYGAPAA
jgi:hypothetical protein